MTERLSAAMRDRLDALVAVGDDDPHSPLHRIKSGSSSPSVGGMKRLLARLELIEATGVLEVDVGWVNGNYQRILFHTVRTASADRVREMAAPRRHLALVCFLHQAWRDTLDQAVDMYGKLLDRNRKLVEARLDDMLKAQRQAVDRIVHRYRRLGAVLLDPDVGDDELRARLLSTVPEAQLREDQSDLASWTRGDRKARFEQTAERHAGLSRFAGPFLSRMKFVDEKGEGASPTLSALRAYREHRAAGRRGVPPDAPLDFAPVALQPLIRHDGVTDRRRWESALFLKVRDEIQTGNLAIDGAKNFGRFEAFFLPAAEWERVREAFWARTGFPVDPCRGGRAAEGASVGCVRPVPGRCRRQSAGRVRRRRVAAEDGRGRAARPVAIGPPRRVPPLAGRPQPLDPAATAQDAPASTTAAAASPSLIERPLVDGKAVKQAGPSRSHQIVL